MNNNNRIKMLGTHTIDKTINNCYRRKQGFDSKNDYRVLITKLSPRRTGHVSYYNT